MIKRLLFLICIAVAISAGLRFWVVDKIYVASASMEPTLPVGTQYLVNLLAYRFSAPSRGDIIVFRSPVDHKTGFIKRVIAIPGDSLEMRDKRVILNGAPLDEPYAVYYRANERLAGDNLGPITVPDQSVFVLGDNRDLSFDSTTWRDQATGDHIYFLPFKDIKGRLVQFT